MLYLHKLLAQAHGSCLCGHRCIALCLAQSLFLFLQALFAEVAPHMIPFIDAFTCDRLWLRLLVASFDDGMIAARKRAIFVLACPGALN